MTTNPTVLSYILQAGIVVKIVMLLLLLASVCSWAFIIQRVAFFRQVELGIKCFTERFWSGVHLDELFSQTRKQTRNASLTCIFNAGFEEYQRLNEHTTLSAQAKLDNIERAMRIESNRVVARLQHNLSFLATVGSVSPYIGLFGTVWGIMTSFNSLGGAQQATIAMVAPGISEALIATAFGLFAAIPAVIAFNRFTHKLSSMAGEMDNFSEELIKILHRQVHA